MVENKNILKNNKMVKIGIVLLLLMAVVGLSLGSVSAKKVTHKYKGHFKVGDLIVIKPFKVVIERGNVGFFFNNYSSIKELRIVLNKGKKLGILIRHSTNVIPFPKVIKYEVVKPGTIKKDFKHSKSIHHYVYVFKK